MQCERYRTMLEEIASWLHLSSSMVSRDILHQLDILLGLEPNDIILYHDMVKVNIILGKDATTATISRAARVGGITDFNWEQALKFGVITGMVSNSKLDFIRIIPGVQTVELEKPKTGG